MSIDSRINYKAFYEMFVNNIERTDEDQYVGLCPLHSDTKPSFSFNGKTGQWTCFAECGSGNIWRFVELKTGLTGKTEKIKWLESTLDIKLDLRKIIDNKIWRKFHCDLLANHGAIDYLTTERGLSLDTIKQFKLGFRGEKYCIPIFSATGDCINIRLYHPKPKTAASKMISYSEGTGKNKINYGGMSLFPVSILNDHKKIVVTEGEMDCMLLNQMGFPAVTVTGGAGSFKAEWAKEFFIGKHVFICFDIDIAGDRGALRVAKILHTAAESVRVIELKTAISEPRNADITDYFVGFQYQAKDFADLMKDAKPYQDFTHQQKKVRSTTFKKVELSKASHFANAMRGIEVKALVSGKNFPPYEIPNKCELSCEGKFSDKLCPFCPMYMEDEFKKVLILEDQFENGSILNLIDVSDTTLFNNLRKMLKVPTACNRLKIDTQTYVNVEELVLIPEIDFSADEDYEYVQQVAYYIGHGIRPNVVYNFKGVALPDPRTQQATQLYSEARPATDSIDQFKMNAELLKKFSIFQATEDSVDGVFSAYKRRYADMEKISGIYERMDIALGYDIVMHSALRVIFQGKEERGWMEMLLIGDSGCGKTELAKSMINHYRVGEFVTGENATVAGLMGGLSQTSKRWNLNWGKIPLNNRRLVFIDEVSGMSTDMISQFSGMRSSGIAELTKIRTEKTMAQTRKIWIGNPRKIGQTSRNMMEYSYGCIAVRELVGLLEDIRRFCFVVTAHSEEVNSSVYNERKDQGDGVVEHTSNLCHSLVLWAWSRTKKDITIQETATQAILEYAEVMGKKYTHQIPICEPADQRLKLMRGSVAIAAMLFSTNNNGNNIVVKKCHVDFFYGWLERIYNKDSMRYGEWSAAEIARKVLKDQNKVTAVLPNDIIDLLIESDFLNLSIIIELTGYERATVKTMVSTLARNNALKRMGTSGFIKTQAFITYLNKRKSGAIPGPTLSSGEEQPF